MNSDAGSIVVRACLVIFAVYKDGANSSVSTPAKAQTGSTLSSRKRHNAGMVADAVWVRVAPMLEEGVVRVCVLSGSVLVMRWCEVEEYEFPAPICLHKKTPFSGNL